MLIQTGSIYMQYFQLLNSINFFNSNQCFQSFHSVSFYNPNHKCSESNVDKHIFVLLCIKNTFYYYLKSELIYPLKYLRKFSFGIVFHLKIIIGLHFCVNSDTKNSSNIFYFPFVLIKMSCFTT